MKLGLTLVQFMEIEEALPVNYSLCQAEGDDYFLMTADAYIIKPVIETVILNLYNQTLEDFFDSLPRKYVISVLREEGEIICDRFLERNRDDGITNEQSSWVLGRAGPITTLLRVGALKNAKQMLMALTPDDMTQSFHWITQERIDLIIEEIDLALQNN